MKFGTLSARTGRYALICGALCLLTAILRIQAGDIYEFLNGPNAPEQRNKPYVLLLSLDGFRHDYAERYGATNLLALAGSGIRAEGLIPVYPSLTFPSHYSIVTGLRPERHGLVGMRFYDPESREFFSYTERRCLTNGHWYGGTPLWVLAERQGLRTASFYWVGAEAEIGGFRPSFYGAYDISKPNVERIEKVLEWLGLPEETRPHFAMLYFSDVDVAGHRYGPESPETREAVKRVDSEVGVLRAKLEESGRRVNLIVLSDHGMAVREEERILLYQLVDLSGVTAQSNGSHAAIYSTNRTRLEAIYRELKNKDQRFSVFWRKDVPAHLHYTASDRIGDLVILPNGPYLLNVTPPTGALPGGMHGYDPTKFTEMNGIFFAAGPNLAERCKTGPVNGLDVYPLIARILGLILPADLDGKFSRVEHLYRERNEK